MHHFSPAQVRAVFRLFLCFENTLLILFLPKLLNYAQAFKTFYKSKGNLLCLESTWDESGLDYKS